MTPSPPARNTCAEVETSVLRSHKKLLRKQSSKLDINSPNHNVNTLDKSFKLISQRVKQYDMAKRRVVCGRFLVLFPAIPKHPVNIRSGRAISGTKKTRTVKKNWSAHCPQHGPIQAAILSKRLIGRTLFVLGLC